MEDLRSTDVADVPWRAPCWRDSVSDSKMNKGRITCPQDVATRLRVPRIAVKGPSANLWGSKESSDSPAMGSAVQRREIARMSYYREEEEVRQATQSWKPSVIPFGNSRFSLITMRNQRRNGIEKNRRPLGKRGNRPAIDC